MDIGEKIKALRENHGLTLEELGKRVGVGKSTVRKWENGMIANMRRDKIAKIAAALDVSPAYLMGWEDEPTAATDPAATPPTSASSVSPVSIPSLRDDEQGLLDKYNLLNDNGKADLHNRADELIALGRTLEADIKKVALASAS